MLSAREELKDNALGCLTIGGLLLFLGLPFWIMPFSEADEPEGDALELMWTNPAAVTIVAVIFGTMGVLHGMRGTKLADAIAATLACGFILGLAVLWVLALAFALYMRFWA